MNILFKTEFNFSRLSEQSVDAISATANMHWLLPHIADHYGWNPRDLRKASELTNARGEVAVLSERKPLLLLVPKTGGKKEVPALVKDLLEACNACSVRSLQFSHYGRVLGRPPWVEIESILTFLRDYKAPCSLETIVWDIDSRYADELTALYERIFEDK